MVNMEGMLNEVNKDKKIDASEIKRLDSTLKSPKNTVKLKEAIQKDKTLFANTKESFKNTLREIANGTSDLTPEEQQLVKQAYEELFQNEQPLGQGIGLNDYMTLSEFQGGMILLPDNFVNQGIVSQPLVLKKDTFREVFVPNINPADGVQGIENSQQQKKKLSEFLSTEKGKQVREDSQKFWQFEGIYDRIGNKDMSSEHINKVVNLNQSYNTFIDSMQTTTQELATKLQEKKDWSKDYQEAKKDNPTARAEDFHMESAKQSSSLRSEYKQRINSLLKGFAKDVGNNVIAQNIDKVKNGEVVNFDIGQVNIKLDFGQIKDQCVGKTDAEIQHIFEQNFDKIYRDSFPEKSIDEAMNVLQNFKNNPKETAIEAVSIIFAGMAAVAFTTETGGLGILQAGTTYSIAHDCLKADLYATFIGDDSKSSFYKGLGYSQDMSLGQYLSKKGLEYGSNYALFSIFQGTGAMMNKMGASKFESNIAINSVKGLGAKAGIQGAKLGVEAGFFSAFQLGAGSLDGAIQNKVGDGSVMGETSFMESLNSHYENLSKPENLINSFVYNTMFVGAVKTGGFFGGKLVESPIDTAIRSKTLQSELSEQNNKLVEIISQLDKKGYRMVEGRLDKSGLNLQIVDGNGKQVPLDSPEFLPLANVLSQMNQKGKELHRLRYSLLSQGTVKKAQDEQDIGKFETKPTDPESGRGGTGQETNIRGKTLEDVLSGFKDGGQLSPRFEGLANKFKSYKDYNAIRGKVETEIQQELKQFLGRDNLNTDELTFAREKTEEFMEALSDRIKIERGEQKEMDKRYGNPEIMKKLMFKFVEYIPESKRNEFIQTSRNKFELPSGKRK